MNDNILNYFECLEGVEHAGAGANRWPFEIPTSTVLELAAFPAFGFGLCLVYNARDVHENE